MITKRFKQEIETAQPGAVIVCNSPAQKKAAEKHAARSCPSKGLTFVLLSDDEWAPAQFAGAGQGHERQR